MDLNMFVQRARQALASPTLYWLGHGGSLATEALPPVPGRKLNLAQALERLRQERPTVHEAYMAALDQSGLDRATLPPLACDCSGYVCWALGVPRNGSPLPGGWINTDSMHADATQGGQLLFEALEKAVAGALLVHPKPGGQNGGPGHVAIVTEVDAQGRATRMLHCAPGNYLLEPPAGLPRNAIAETDTHLFDAIATTRLVMWKGFVS